MQLNVRFYNCVNNILLIFFIVQAGTNLQFISSGTESPRKKKGFDRKNLKVEPIVNVLFNDLKFRSTVMKRNANPEWDQTFFL